MIFCLVFFISAKSLWNLNTHPIILLLPRSHNDLDSCLPAKHIPKQTPKKLPQNMNLNPDIQVRGSTYCEHSLHLIEGTVTGLPPGLPWKCHHLPALQPLDEQSELFFSTFSFLQTEGLECFMTSIVGVPVPINIVSCQTFFLWCYIGVTTWTGSSSLMTNPQLYLLKYSLLTWSPYHFVSAYISKPSCLHELYFPLILNAVLSRLFCLLAYAIPGGRVSISSMKQVVTHNWLVLN